MSGFFAAYLANWNDRAALHATDTTGSYRIDRVLAGGSSLHALEPAELGDVTGLDLFDETQTYTGDECPLAHPRNYEWIHPLGDVVTALVEAGMAIDFLREHDILVWRAFPGMVEAGEDQFALPPGGPRIPLSFSIGATKDV